MAVLFAVFAALQLNDPDAILWLAAYGFAVVVSLLDVRGTVGRLPLVGLIVYGAWFAMLAPALGPGWFDDEVAREAIGLLIAAIWMGALAWLSRSGVAEAA